MIDLHRQIMLNSIRDFLHTKMKVILGGGKNENRKYTQAHVVGRDEIGRNKDRRAT